MFNFIKNFVNKLTGETKRKSLYAEKQRLQNIKITNQMNQERQSRLKALPKIEWIDTPKRRAFLKRLVKRRIKNIMKLNTQRKQRGLFQYQLN